MIADTKNKLTFLTGHTMEKKVFEIFKGTMSLLATDLR